MVQRQERRADSPPAPARRSAGPARRAHREAAHRRPLRRHRPCRQPRGARRCAQVARDEAGGHSRSRADAYGRDRDRRGAVLSRRGSSTVIERASSSGATRVVASGLDQDFRGLPFGSMPEAALPGRELVDKAAKRSVIAAPARATMTAAASGMGRPASRRRRDDRRRGARLHMRLAAAPVTEPRRAPQQRPASYPREIVSVSPSTANGAAEPVDHARTANRCTEIPAAHVRARRPEDAAVTGVTSIPPGPRTVTLTSCQTHRAVAPPESNADTLRDRRPPRSVEIVAPSPAGRARDPRQAALRAASGKGERVGVRANAGS